MRSVRGTDRGVTGAVTPLLALLTVAVYGLVITGAVASLNEAARACSSWPLCEGALVPGLGQSALLVAYGHRLATMIVLVVLVATTLAVWARGAPRPVRWTLALTTVAFPIQIATGAVTAITGGHAVLSVMHLVSAMAIFGGVLASFLLWLEWESRSVEAGFDPDPPPTDAVAPDGDPAGSTIRAYLRLMKPRLMWLLCIVALAAMGLATATTGRGLTVPLVVGTMLGGVLSIGASGTFNNVLERDADRHMARTADRPVVRGAVPPRRAMAFGIALTVLSLVTFLVLVNPLAAGLGLLAIAFYSVGYTLVLKPHTSQNIVIGGAVGAMPALIGWAAVTNAIGLPALVLGLVIFLWTPAHFYNLALVYRRDYDRGGFPMLPVVKGEAVTQRHIVAYFGATVLAVGLLGLVGGLGWLFATTAVATAGLFVLMVIGLFRRRTRRSAMRTFHASNAMLGLLMLAIVLETIVL